jgi:hypothetical protein
MVSRPQRLLLFSIFFVVLFAINVLVFAPPVSAQGVTYNVTQEWVQVQINSDATIDFGYNLTVVYLSGQPQGIVSVGMPRGGFQIQRVEDRSGSSLQFQDISQGNYYGIDVYLKSPIILNQPNTFTIDAHVPQMVYADETNPGNDGLQFYPTTFATAVSPISNLRVAIILPPGVQANQTKYPTGFPFDSEFLQGDSLVVYWERINWPQGQTFQSGVSFPAQFISPLPTPGPSNPPFFTYLIIGVLVLVVFGFIGLVIAGFGKSAYQKPLVSVEALGANRSLTAVEAGYVMEKAPVHVLTMILYGMLRKHMVQVVETAPVLKLSKVPPTQPDSSPRYYEIDYLKAIKLDGTLDEKNLALTYITVANSTDEKLRGYSREETKNYYKSVVDQAWGQVKQAGTPELKGDEIDKNLEWLLNDDKFNDKFANTFPPGIIISPLPAWWWYWGGPRSSPIPGSPVPQTPAPGGPQQLPMTPPPMQAKPLPGQDFANNIVRGVQTASNNVVTNVQDFANKLVPVQKQAQSQKPITEKKSCVCACHNCACACACVSCACACAGGGAR